ncbi:MAG: hypothetical protein A2Y39_02210 [Candidatus Delongbacteria bacterium GWF2_40_14]|nr:MAG: hypothetical protein A2Y39_02210 [Candidatus Delongbacteria bacterium GWF2_40_14]
MPAIVLSKLMQLCFATCTPFNKSTMMKKSHVSTLDITKGKYILLSLDFKFSSTGLSLKKYPEIKKNSGT